MNDKDKNYIFFTKQLPELMRDKKGKFVLIKDESIIQIYDEFEKAIDSATKEKKFELGTFIIQKIEDETHYISRLA